MALHAPSERRAHQRVVVGFTVECRRLGRPSAPVLSARAVDLSLGGIRVVGSLDLDTGDVVLLTVTDDGETLGLKGMVVSSTVHLDTGGERHVHIAFTGLSGDAMSKLGRIIDLHESR